VFFLLLLMPLAENPFLNSSTAVPPNGCTYISYDDPASIRAKASLSSSPWLSVVLTCDEGRVCGGRGARGRDRLDHCAGGTYQRLEPSPRRALHVLPLRLYHDRCDQRPHRWRHAGNNWYRPEKSPEIAAHSCLRSQELPSRPAAARLAVFLRTPAPLSLALRMRSVRFRLTADTASASGTTNNGSGSSSTSGAKVAASCLPALLLCLFVLLI
jgi:hypothetical protein